MKITFLGDIMLNLDQIEAYRTEKSYDFDEAFNSFKNLFSDSDYIIANLETPVAGEKYGLTNEKYCFNSPLQLALSLKNNGIDLVTTANNHCLDRGIEGLRATIDGLNSINLDHLGTHEPNENSFLVKKIGDYKIGFVSYTYGTNAFWNNKYLKKKEKYYVDMFQEQELHNIFVRILYKSSNIFIRAVRKICRLFCFFQLKKPVYERSEYSYTRLKSYRKAINNCKKQGVDFIFSILHVGGQYNDAPTKLTKWICRKTFKYGANAIIANHEHVIHGVDNKTLEEGKFCFYSLGNCFSSTGVQEEPFDKYSQYSAAISVTFQEKQQSFDVIILTSVLCGKKIIVKSLYDLIIEEKDNLKKEKLMEDNNYVLNSIFNTSGKDYPLQKEYKIV